MVLLTRIDENEEDHYRNRLNRDQISAEIHKAKQDVGERAVLQVRNLGSCLLKGSRPF